MKLLSTLVQTTRKLTLGFLAICPLLIVAPLTLAETENPVEFSQKELDQMLAPIALYPDTVLSQVLIASTYPLEVIQADRWARNNSSVKGAEAVKMVENKDWDPSVKALVAFPDILQKMSEDVDWTQRLGDAFLSNEELVMDTVQRLRKRAYASGSLEKVQHLKVEQEDNHIIIEPAEERVVYVPVYDTRVVYGNWWWPDYPPVYWHYPASYVYVSGFYWGSSIYVGPTFFYSSCGWRQRRVVVVDYHNHYNNAPHFYTSRSIVTYQGAREWRHDPAHRRGVAYYNDDLRNSYGSRHESYRNDHVYREQHRDNYTPTHRSGEGQPGNSPRVIQSQERDTHVSNGNPRSYDRAEQLRDRMGRQENREDVNRTGTINVNDHNGQQIDRSFNRNNQNGNNNAQPAQPAQRENIIRSNEEQRVSVERAQRAQQGQPQNVQREAPRIEVPRVETQRTETPRTEAPRTFERNDNNNRQMRVDDSASRRVESPRAERSGGDNNGNSRAGRHSRDEG